jgi:hypothetical protein
VTKGYVTSIGTGQYIRLVNQFGEGVSSPNLVNIYIESVPGNYRQVGGVGAKGNSIPIAIRQYVCSGYLIMS